MNTKLQSFRTYLVEEEKSEATIQKYLHDVAQLLHYLDAKEITKERLLEYRMQLTKIFQISTVNGKISAINSYLQFVGKTDCRLKFIKYQRKVFVEEQREMTKNDYKKLLQAAKEEKKERIYYLMLTLASTGIRVSELQFLTVEALKKKKINIYMKGKTRVVLLQKELCDKLKTYIKKEKIKSGCVFRTKTGRPMDRSNIWKELKRLCEKAKVDREKVFPRNFRHLFARTFYQIEKSLAYLADVLGHSSVETTRIYYGK